MKNTETYIRKIDTKNIPKKIDTKNIPKKNTLKKDIMKKMY
jgi:hypothetical protein